MIMVDSRNDIFPDLFLPDPLYGTERCAIAKDVSVLVYQLGPSGILLCINFIFFVNTILSVRRIQRMASIATTNCSSNRNKQS
jgi:hypothetical protein